MRNLMLSRFCIRRTYHQLFQKSSSVVCRGYFQLVRCEVGRMASEAEVRKVWRSADAVCFDVDSTVCVDEAIDELAAFLGKGQQVAQLTSQAMGGSMTYKDSLRRRLEIMQPSRQNVKDFISQHPPKLTQGVRELVKLLRKRNIPVYLISGGFTAIIESVADELNIPHQLIYANIITFDKEGNYSGFDEDQPTCQSGGKPLVIQKLKDSHGYKQLVHVGDGATDMEACPPADAFIGFGGNQVREKVKVGSKWFVMNIQEMIDELHLSSEPSLHVLN